MLNVLREVRGYAYPTRHPPANDRMQRKDLITESWKDYELLDSGDGIETRALRRNTRQSPRDAGDLEAAKDRPLEKGASNLQMEGWKEHLEVSSPSAGIVAALLGRYQIHCPADFLQAHRHIPGAGGQLDLDRGAGEEITKDRPWARQRTDLGNFRCAQSPQSLRLHRHRERGRREGGRHRHAYRRLQAVARLGA